MVIYFYLLSFSCIFIYSFIYLVHYNHNHTDGHTHARTYDKISISIISNIPSQIELEIERHRCHTRELYDPARRPNTDRMKSSSQAGSPECCNSQSNIESSCKRDQVTPTLHAHTSRPHAARYRVPDTAQKSGFIRISTT